MKKGRPPKLDPHVRMNVYVREDLLARFNILNFDVEKKRVKFGAFSDFVNESLAEYLAKNERRIT